jgi:hypothetical protein
VRIRSEKDQDCESQSRDERFPFSANGEILDAHEKNNQTQTKLVVQKAKSKGVNHAKEAIKNH